MIDLVQNPQLKKAEWFIDSIHSYLPLAVHVAGACKVCACVVKLFGSVWTYASQMGLFFNLNVTTAFSKGYLLGVVSRDERSRECSKILRVSSVGLQIWQNSQFVAYVSREIEFGVSKTVSRFGLFADDLHACLTIFHGPLWKMILLLA